jgi:4-amino-4-deoxy-L-arabinose transferase-like glycosyltransferase
MPSLDPFALTRHREGSTFARMSDVRAFSLRPIVWVCVAIGLLALTARCALLFQIVSQNPPEAVDRFAGDSRQYVDLAKNLVEFGAFAVDGPRARPAGTTYFSLLRPPVYPLFVATFDAVGWRGGVIWAQGILGSVLPVLVTLLAYAFFGSRVVAGVVGVVAALSPTGIGLPGLILADLPFAFCFTVAFALLAVATSTRRTALYLFSGAAFGIASLVKPAGLYWAVVLPLVAWCLARWAGQRVCWKPLLGAIALSLAILSVWAARNYAKVGLFTISTVDAQNLRYYLAPQVLEWIRVDAPPDKGPLRRHRERVMERDEADLPELGPAAIVRRQWRESIETFRTYPLQTLRAYAFNVKNHFTTPFNHFHYQMPQGGRLRAMLERADVFATSRAVFWTAIALVVSAVVLPWTARVRDEPWRRRYGATLAVLLTYGYLIVFSGTTYATGSRIIFPAQFALLLLFAGGVVSAARDLPSRFRKADASTVAG